MKTRDVVKILREMEVSVPGATGDSARVASELFQLAKINPSIHKVDRGVYQYINGESVAPDSNSNVAPRDADADGKRCSNQAGPEAQGGSHSKKMAVVLRGHSVDLSRFSRSLARRGLGTPGVCLS